MNVLSLLPQRLDPGATPTFAGLLASDGTAAAPSISFTSATNLGFYKFSATEVGFGSNNLTSIILSSGGRIFGAEGNNVITGNSSGAWSITAAGTNQSITLTPSGSGYNSTGAQYFSGKTGAAPGAITNFGVFIGTTQGSGDGVGLGDNGYGLYKILQSYGSSLAINPGGNNVLVGTTVNSGALLQIGTNTTNLAGGMIFGTDVGLFRSDSQALGIAHIGGTNPLFHLIEGTTKKLQIGTNSGDVYFDSLTAGKGLYFRSGNQTLALTLDSSQNATFAGLARLPAGTVAAPSLSFGDTDTGLLSGGANAVSVATNGVERVTFFDNGMNIKNVTAPSGTPSGGGYLYSEAGALKWKGSSGTVTTIAAA